MMFTAFACMAADAGLDVGNRIQLAMTFFTALAALAAWWSAGASKRASEAELFTSVIGQYSSVEMLHSLEELRRWRESNDPNFTTRWRRSLSTSFHENVRGWAKASRAKQPDKQAVDLDEHRRRVVYFFALAALLIEKAKLSEGFKAGFKRLLGKNLYLDVALPMEHAIRGLRGAKNDDTDEGWQRLTQIHRAFFPGQMIPLLPPDPESTLAVPLAVQGEN